jgi:hypothetical protein
MDLDFNTSLCCFTWDSKGMMKALDSRSKHAQDLELMLLIHS